MGDARAKGVGTRGVLNQQELYFRLSAASAEEERLRSQLEMMRAKERHILTRLQTLAQHMARLQQNIDAMVVAAGTQRGKQSNELGYGALAWEVTELHY
jgi:phage terminase Nu1 subunit (DNA packaging protein)